MKIEIRKAESADANNLAVLKQQVWISTYATDGLTDEFSSYVLSEYAVKNIKMSVENSNSITLVALCNNCLVGCVEIILTPQCPIEGVDPCIEITTLYILERFQNMGIGKKLLDESIHIIESLHYSRMWLSVYHKNERAIDFYHRQNFTRIGEIDFELGEAKHKNYIMLRDVRGSTKGAAKQTSFQQ